MKVMKVRFYQYNKPMESREICCMEDIQELVGGWVELLKFNMNTKESFLGDEEGLLKKLPRNEHFPQYVGNIVVIEDDSWNELPYSKSEVQV